MKIAAAVLQLASRKVSNDNLILWIGTADPENSPPDIIKEVSGEMRKAI